MLTIARGTSGADSVEPIAVIRLSLKPALLSPISAENISISNRLYKPTMQTWGSQGKNKARIARSEYRSVYQNG
jgi:hypothetical protein